MSTNTLVMKFGGSSVGTTTALTQVLSIVLHEQPRWKRLLLVVSALDGVTDALLEAAHLAQLSNRRGYRRITATLRTRHLALVEKLPLGSNERNALQADIDRLLFDMLNICQTISDNTADPMTPDTIDAIIGVGERLATRIVAALLRQNNVRGVAIDTTELIVTDDVYGNATPNMTLTKNRIDTNLIPMLDRQIVPVLTGFIAGTQSGKPTTLGRGGSDYTASILSVCVNADEVWIWSDVDGIMSADPREIQEARVIPELSYHEMAELAFFGARVLHSRMVIPLREHNIPLRIKNVFKPQLVGTLVYQRLLNQQAIKAITAIQGISLQAPWSGSLVKISSLLDETLLSTVGIHADVSFSVQSSSATFLCVIIPTSAGPDAVHIVKNTLEARLSEKPEFQGWTAQPVSVITVIGAELNGNPQWSAQILGRLSSIKLLAVAQSPAECSFSVIVDPKDTEHTLTQLHPLTMQSTKSTR
ncbi:MAG: aspartate kinase [Anaerolineae bacterium]|nr:aspartate kinase [Anaerolineae bacterium]